jgi:hypothetical protein
MAWQKKPLKDVIGRFVQRIDLLQKTVNRQSACYFKLGDFDCFDIKCTSENLIELKYKITGFYHHINYDMRNDSVSYYVTAKYSGHWKFSAPDQITNYTSLRTACTEEGYFQQMTIQDLSEFEMDDIISLIKFVDTVYYKTEAIRNAASTKV